MFTIFDDKLDAFARRCVAQQREFHAGQWTQERLLAHQWQNLRQSLRYARGHSPFYAERLAGLTEPTIDRLEAAEFARTVPFTTKQDLRDRRYDLLSKPVSESWVFYETTGTTGPATPCPRDNTDSIVNNAALTVAYREIFEKHGDDHVVAVLGPTELHSTGDTFGDVCRNLGHAVVKMWPYSPVVGFDRALQMLRELDATAVFCTPGMAMSLAKEAQKAGLDPAADFSLRLLMFVGELVTPKLLENLGTIWNAEAYSCMYASQEASILGAAQADGRVHTVPLNVYYEVIDPESAQRVAPDEHQVREGELVITHLYQGAKPLVRYRTGDLVRLEPAGPEEAHPSETLTPLGRVRDRIDLNGRAVTAYLLEDFVLSRVPGCHNYHITIDRESGADVLAVDLEMPTADQSSLKTLVESAAAALGCRMTVRTTALDAITTTGAMVSWKAARIRDLRTAGDDERETAMAIARKRDAR
ncbi:MULTISPECIES: phenylacetate--CoA ligase family protein [unclassified Streptomyces]|uniref:phenylacetate--CoA ligase family protein n=1 Tax=unclassified Streptomyces TaxID=2593676 RepID=UPI0038198697